MSDDQNAFAESSNLLSAWIQMAAGFWGTMLQTWTESLADQQPAEASDTQNKSRSQESLEAVLKTWQTLSKVVQDPGTSEALSNLTRTMPDILQKMVQAGWQGFFHIQQQWLEKAGNIERSSQAYSFDHIDKNTFKTWTDIYENEFRQFFHIPQLGLTRLYQERVNQAMDNYHRFQSAFAEFMYLFYMPMEKSLKVLQDEMAKMAESGDLTEDYTTYYRMWIKILEGHYMTLFKSSEYVQAMGTTLDRLEEFMQTRNEVFHDMLKTMSVPTQKDMDDLYKEIYQLKKRIRILEKKT